MNKNFFLSLLTLLGISVVAFGQQGNRISIDEYVQNLTNKLELTQSQTDSVKMILEEQREEITKLKENANGNRRIMRSHMMEINYVTDRRIELLLNDKQKKVYKDYVKEKRSKRPMMQR